MTEGRLDLALPPPASAWGDRAAPWIPDTIGRRARAAEAPWKTDPDPDFPDTVLDHGRIGDITVLACAARGSKHRFEGTARQDAVIARAATGTWALAAVADGVGSVPESQKASVVAVRVVVTELAKRLAIDDADPEQLAQAAFREVNGKLAHLAGPKTTLTAAAVAAVPGPGGVYRAWVAGVGDSPAYLLRDGGFAAVRDLERDDEFGTFTAAMPTRDLKGHFRFDELSLYAGEALALVSDGLGDLLGAPSDEPRRYFAANWSAPPNPVAFMRQVQVRSRGFDDDRSAAVLWAAPPPAAVPVLRDADSSMVHDVELRAARTQGLEVRSAAGRGLKAAKEGRHRRTRTLVIEHSARLVALACAPLTDDGDQARHWFAAAREAIEAFPPDHPSQDWAGQVWSQAARGFAVTADPWAGRVATAIVCAEPAGDGAVDYELAVSGALSVSIAGAGIHRDLGTVHAPRYVWYTGPGEAPCRVHVDRLAPDQALLVTSGVDPAGIARLPERPGPLGTAWALEDQGAEEDRLALMLWGER